MQSLFGMRNARAQDRERECCRATHHPVVCDRLFVGLVLWTLVHTSEALAGEPMAAVGAMPQPEFLATRSAPALSESWFTLPPSYQAAEMPEAKPFSTENFRPRGRSLLERDTTFSSSNEVSLMRGTTVWQRLRDYRTRDRVRVVTLWETGGSSVSLQAGKKGDPSLQWTSRAMNRGGATRGLFDEFLTTSIRGVGRGLHWGSHQTSTEPPLKPLRSLDAGLSGGATAK